MIKMMPLKQVCSGIIDCPHESPEWLSKGIPVIRNFNLVDGQIDMSDASYVDESTYTKRTRRAVPSAGDIIFSREAPIGNCAIVPADFKCCLGQRLVLLRVNRKICSPEYLLAALLSDFVKTQIFQVEKSGSIVSNFNISDLGDLIIPIIDRQESVASVSDTLNKKLLLNKNICAELEAMAKTLYDYWFTQFDFPDADGMPYRSSGGEMVWNDHLKREIPKGWETTSIGNIVQNYDSKRVPLSQNERDTMKGDIPYYGATGIMDYVNKHIFDGQYVLIAEDGSVMDAKGNPIVQMIWGKTWVNNHAHVLEGCNGYSNELLYLMLQHIPVIKIMTGSIQKKINQDNLNGYIIPLIPETISQAFYEIVKPMFEKLQTLKEENDELTKLRDWLLPMLMNGQATVE